MQDLTFLVTTDDPSIAKVSFLQEINSHIARHGHRKFRCNLARSGQTSNKIESETSTQYCDSPHSISQGRLVIDHHRSNSSKHPLKAHHEVITENQIHAGGVRLQKNRPQDHAIIRADSLLKLPLDISARDRVLLNFCKFSRFSWKGY